MQLKGRVVIITGAASGIGAALARAFLGEGAAAVIGADLRDEGVPAGCAVRRCDVTSEAAIERLVH